MEKEIYLYPYSAAEARTRNELALWRASYQANEECARDIGGPLRPHFDGAPLNDSMRQPLLDKWGYKRINFVLPIPCRSLATMDASAERTKSGRKPPSFRKTVLTTSR